MLGCVRKTSQRARASHRQLRQLREYYSKGLEDCPENAQLIEQWILKNVNGTFAKGSVIEAVENQRARLRWRKVEAKPATPATQQVEQLAILPDGSRQLSLSLPCPSSATLAQAKDYLARVRKLQQPDVVVVDGYKSAI
jgi:hypothetical protein